MGRITEQDMQSIFEFFGAPERIRKDLEVFKRNIDWFEERNQRLTEEHPHKWAVVLVGEDGSPELHIVDDSSAVTAILGEAGIRRRTSLVRYLDPDPRPLILQALSQ